MKTNTPGKNSKCSVPLLLGAAWNIVFGSLGLYNGQLTNSLFLNSITPQTRIIASQYLWAVVLLAGIGYALVGIFNDRFRFFITFGAMGKIAMFMFGACLWFNAAATDFALIIVTGDLIWAAYFIYFLSNTREYGYF